MKASPITAVGVTLACLVAGCNDAPPVVSKAPVMAPVLSPPRPVTVGTLGPRRQRVIRYRLTSLHMVPDGGEVDVFNIDNGDLLHVDGNGHVLFSDELYEDGRWKTLKNTSSDPSYNQPATIGINDAGIVLGDISGDSSGAYTIYFGEAVVWQHGQMRVVGSPPDFDETADAINNQGDVLVTSADENNSEQYVYTMLLYHQGKKITIGPGEAECLNDQDQIVYKDVQDTSIDTDGNTLLWTQGKTQTFQVPLGYASRGIVTARLNNRDQAVGTVDTGQVSSVNRGEFSSSDISHAFLWEQGRLQDLGTLGGEDSGADDINNVGQVVGWAETTRPDHRGNVPFHAFLWQKGKMTDLNDLIPGGSEWVLQRADAINERGQIVGVGNKGAFLLTPISRAGTFPRRRVFTR